MAKKSRPKDPMQLAKFIGEIATGERSNDKAEFLLAKQGGNVKNKKPIKKVNK
jgi:hypothetical protein